MMAESSIEPAGNLWSVPECPFQIEAQARVLDDIRLAVVDAFFSLPRGGAEIGGVLLGRYRPGRLAITGYAPLDCEHAFGPSFTLSPADEARLKTLLISHSGGPEDARPVGWYHSHTRSEILLSDADLAIHNRYFPERWQVALVMKPHTFQPARIGYFFREADGRIRKESSYREATLEALPLRPAPAGMRRVEASSDQLPLRRWRPEEQAAERETVMAAAAAPVAPFPVTSGNLALAPAPEPVPERAELPAPQFLPSEPAPSRRWIWMVAIGVSVGVGAAGFQTKQAWLPRVMAIVNPAPVAAPAPPPLSLNLTDRDGELQITWDRSSPALTQSRDALLEIADGPTLQAVPLDAMHLRAGSFTYVRRSERVDVKLIVHQQQAPDLREATSFLGQMPERKPVEDAAAQKQREDLANEAAKLKLDLNWQMLKTKKLEKDLESMREEMKQQQMRRLNNQVMDK
jgi:proteasome lid subunit RPN8/RPN11